MFAWLPTITSVSRQSVFAGKPPLYYPTSLQTTDKEAMLWNQFWADHGLTPVEVGHAKGLGEAGTLSIAEEIVSHPHVRAVLIASGIHAGSLSAMVQSPALFPFALGPLSATHVEPHNRIELFRQGLDEDLVALRGVERLSDKRARWGGRDHV